MLNFLQSVPVVTQLDSIDFKGKVEEVAEIIQTTPTSELLVNFGEKLLGFGLKVLAALLIYFVGAWFIKWIKKLLNNMFIRRNTDLAIASFTKSLVSISLTILLILTTVGTLGINTTSLAAILAAGGMAIGMALSGTVQNFAGGIMLLVFKPFKAGDFIVAQGFSGTVSEVNIVSTKLTTTDNRTIVIPNGALSNGTIDNYSQKPMRRLEWLVDVEYGSSSEVTRTVLKGIAESDARILDKSKGAPADVLIELHALKDSSIEFIMRGWVLTGDYWPVFWAINDRIYNELPKNGIQFPFPQLDVHINQNS
ncbi:MAG: mechanosensitive ion channel [Bacteroidales bacterium]|nr:mechanosensitive ion channel [Bacteroides sp.]MCM1198693.1 mechanosensitive ion channel [Clostridium sp.]MCM1502871.1 mechanosensitive ion channel [Bacteroidales bacterium]